MLQIFNNAATEQFTVLMSKLLCRARIALADQPSHSLMFADDNRNMSGSRAVGLAFVGQRNGRQAQSQG